MTLVAMHASFALFQVDRISRQIPVIEPMAAGMEAESFLSDRSGRQHERPEPQFGLRRIGATPLARRLPGNRHAPRPALGHSRARLTCRSNARRVEDRCGEPNQAAAGNPMCRTWLEVPNRL